MFKLFRKTNMATAVMRHNHRSIAVSRGHCLSKDMKTHQQQMMARGLPKRRSIPGVNHIVLVASGKGGVGKSTTAVNLALSLAQLDQSVGILDADIYGPSIPLMLNVHEKPMVSSKKQMIPLSNYGLKCMSMGFLVNPDEAVVWRGPMVMGAIEKMIHQTEWGDLDYLVIDMPPGTGDIHLSIAQTLNVAGAVVVSTPQRIALADARKGVTMFEKTEIPVLGFVENMSTFVCPKCEEVHHLFGEKGAQKLSKDLSVPFLGAVPIEPKIMAGSDDGVPIVIADPASKTSQCYKSIAEKVHRQLNIE